ncbi:MAG TPA: TrpB-like pyridoxal phosphate-dependent enzyme [Gammaproteobacteria bacterium]|nr:TrpB-like pyridoxal phosphate-dependent enzyme [Gammaproteobacteria bacterium]
MTDTIKYLLDEADIPKQWYNIAADLPEPPTPPLNPGTRQPLSPAELEPLFSRGVIEQEVSSERYIDIPDPVRDIYRQWRPSPLYRARRFERALDTPARIYYKYEGVSPAGSHKPNTAVAQAFYAREEGTQRLTTETGAGQWGSSLALAGAMFGLEIEVFMVRVSFDQKPYRRAFMESFDATCIASPSDITDAGRAILKETPDSRGSLGIAISEAVERAMQRDDTKYVLGSVLNHVLLHQTVIGLEAMRQFELADDYPDTIIACTGGGSNFGGIVFPFLGQQLRGGEAVDIVAVEPTNCPTLTRGKYAYDFGDTAHLTPLVKMHTLGSTFVPPGFHAGGLRYHGMAPLVSQCTALGYVKPRAYEQRACFDAGLQFARAEGILPAPEANHAIAATMDAALECKASGESRAILFNLSGHGHFDMPAYMDYSAGNLLDQHYDENEMATALAALPAGDT